MCHLLNNYGLDVSLTMELGPIQGLQVYTQLREMYEKYYSTKDGHTSVSALPTEDTQDIIHAPPQATSQSVVSAHVPSGEVWSVPTPTEIVVPSNHDFPP